MNNFTRNLLTEWRRLVLPFKGETFVVAVSGGADSVGLLLALNELKERKKLDLRFVVAHFNHGLRGDESDGDARFVKDLANQLEFEFALKKEVISEIGNLEQAARNTRYQFLIDVAENLNAYAVLTAHTLNDQAETFLLNLIRGSGLEGLGAMKAVRDFNLKGQTENLKLPSSTLRTPDLLMEQPADGTVRPQAVLVRPLLSWAKRKDTENFCRQHAIDFRFDTMNEDLAFRRVRIRKVLLPLLEDFNPKVVETLAQTAFLLQADFKVLKSFSDSEKQTVDNFETALKLKDLKNLFPSIRQTILRDWLKNKRGDLRSLDKKHFDSVENLILSRKSGKKVELPNGEFVLKERGSLVFVKSEG